jgi:hypothetical protein
MAFADSTAYKTAIASPKEMLASTINSSTVWATTNPTPAFVSTWQNRALGAASAPSTAVACDRTTSGALGQQNGGSSQLFVCSAELAALHSNSAGGGESSGCLVLADRLTHQGGLVGNVTSTQTTNLPTAALTRYTSGAGVWAAIEVYSNVGATNSNATVSYTNQAGTAAQTATATFGNTFLYGATVTRHMALLSLASGDTGVRSVESVTLSASIGSAGNLGVTLFKPLLFLPMGISDQFQYDVLRGTLGGGLPEILDDACLYWLWSSPPLTGQIGAANAMLSFAEA